MYIYIYIYIHLSIYLSHKHWSGAVSMPYKGTTSMAANRFSH